MPADSGLACLVMLARFHQIAADAEQLVHQFKMSGQGFGQTEILLAAKHLGLQARPVKTTLERLDRTPLPAMAVDSAGGYFILARVDADKALIHDPKAERPQVISRDELLARWTGELIQFRYGLVVAPNSVVTLPPNNNVVLALAEQVIVAIATIDDVISVVLG
jgi:subfamily B ATP-binding cassette protein HlyB/CyaB